MKKLALHSAVSQIEGYSGVGIPTSDFCESIDSHYSNQTQQIHYMAKPVDHQYSVNAILLRKGIISIDAAYGVDNDEAVACVEVVSKRTAETIEAFGDLIEQAK